jgi:hypothetical protein
VHASEVEDGEADGSTEVAVVGGGGGWRFEQSGLTRAEWCRREGVPLHPWPGGRRSVASGRAHTAGAHHGHDGAWPSSAKRAPPSAFWRDALRRVRAGAHAGRETLPGFATSIPRRPQPARPSHLTPRSPAAIRAFAADVRFVASIAFGAVVAAFAAFATLVNECVTCLGPGPSVRWAYRTAGAMGVSYRGGAERGLWQ